MKPAIYHWVDTNTNSEGHHIHLMNDECQGKFTVRKCKLILENLPEVKKFVKAYEGLQKYPKVVKK